MLRPEEPEPKPEPPLPRPVARPPLRADARRRHWPMLGGPLRIGAIPHRQAFGTPTDTPPSRAPRSSGRADAGAARLEARDRPEPRLSLSLGSAMSEFLAKVGTPMKFACRTASNLFGVEDFRFSDDARGSQLKTMHLDIIPVIAEIMQGRNKLH